VADDAEQSSNSGMSESLPEVRVLLVDDQMIIAEAVRRQVCTEKDIVFHAVLDGQQALQAALQWRPTVILQDVVMPGTDGFALVRQYRSHPETRHVPIVLLSSREDPVLKAQGFAVGANDYLVKLPDQLELLARLRYHSAAYCSRLERDAAFRALRDSERKLAEANLQLQKLAEFDSLTGIANRRRFDTALAAEWQRAQRNRSTLSLLLCDVDCFKMYNDTHGHLAGDQCLIRIADVLGKTLRRPADLAARYGGEEFVVLLPETEVEGAFSIAEACRQHVNALMIRNQPAPPVEFVSLSIGVAGMVPEHGTHPTSLIELADRAMYQAKKSGRNQTVKAA